MILTDTPGTNQSTRQEATTTGDAHPSLNKPTKLNRRGLERLDLLLLLVESLDLNGGEAMLWASQNIGLQLYFPNRVELWKKRCSNPLRRTTRRAKHNDNDIGALIYLLSTMADRLYPIIHQLLSKREPENLTSERWSLLTERFKALIKERMNQRRSAVKRILYSDESLSIQRDLLVTLSLASGNGGFNRLRASLLDPTP